MWYVKNGTRVTGPFSLEQLRVMRQRNELSPLHMVSSDRSHWLPAAGMLSERSDAAPGWGAAKARQSMLENPPPPVVPTPPAPDPRDTADWCYLDSARRTCGPVSLRSLEQLFASRALPASTMVCQRSSAEWRPAYEVPELAPVARRTSKSGRAIAAIVAASCMAAAALCIVQRERLLEWSGARQKSVRSLSDEASVAKAVGLVTICERVTLPDGKQLELAVSTGTCFAITSDGVFLTNRHVVNRCGKATKLTLNDGAGRVELERQVLPVVFLDGDRADGEVVHVSQKFDLAVLKIVPRKPLPYFSLSGRPELARGTKVTAIGFPGLANRPLNQGEFTEIMRQSKQFAPLEKQLLERNFRYSQTVGTVSRVYMDGDSVAQIEHDAAINPGNSGGPLVGEDGVVVGINTSGIKDETAMASVYLSQAVNQMLAEIGRVVPSGGTWVP